MIEKSTTFGDEVSLTEAIVEAICELRGTEPDACDFVLYDWIDPDALGALIATPTDRERTVTVTFPIGDFRVAVHSDRTLTVQRTAPDGATPNLDGESVRGGRIGPSREPNSVR